MKLLPVLMLALCVPPAMPRSLPRIAGYGTLRATPFVAGGQRLHWPSGRITLRLSRSLGPAGGAGGVDPREEEASVHAALTAAVRAWTASPYAAVSFELESTGEEAANPARNIVTFADPAPFDDGRCDKRAAAACTLLAYIVETGEIEGASIAFNPYLNFSSIGLAGTVDLAAVMLHEVGHVLGLDHSGLLNAAMSPFVETLVNSTPPAFTPRELSADDLLSLAETYPAGDAYGRLGRIYGIARLDGAPLAGAHVVVVSAEGVSVRDTLTDREGRYGMAAEPGAYQLLIEPLDGPVTAARYAQPPESAGAVFPTLFWTAAGGDSLRAETVTVEEGGASAADFAVAPGEVSNLRRVGVVGSGATAYLFQVDLPRGGEHLLSAIRDPLTGVPSLRVSGSAVQLQGATVRGPDPDLVEQMIDVPADAPPGSLNLYLHNGASGTALAGGLRVTLRPRVNGVRLSGDGTEIVLSGSDLCAVEGRAGGVTQMGGVSVRVGDRFAPLLQVSPAEIRAAVPAGLAPGVAEVTVLAGAGVRSAPVNVELPAH
jgi:hypothetical protein